MTKTITLLIFIFIFPAGIYFLNGCARPCERACFFIKGVKFYSLDNAGPAPKEITDGEVYAKALLLKLSIYDSVKPNYCIRTAPFLNAAYAIYKKCEPERTYSKTDSFTITSNRDFDLKHPAGADLKDIFYFSDSTITSTKHDYEFYLLKEPEAENEHVFTLRFSLSDSTYTTQTTSIKLLKQ